jgi:hypothetical protein
MKNSSLGKMLNTGAHALGTTVSIVALRSGGRADIDLLEEIAATRARQLAHRIRAGRNTDPDMHFADPMYPPGRMVQIWRDDLIELQGRCRGCTLAPKSCGGCGCHKVRYAAEWASTVDFQEIVVSSDMLTSHFPDRVEEALDSVQLVAVDTDEALPSGYYRDQQSRRVSSYAEHCTAVAGASTAGRPLTPQRNLTPQRKALHRPPPLASPASLSSASSLGGGARP